MSVETEEPTDAAESAAPAGEIPSWDAEWRPAPEVTVRGTVVLLPGRGEPASVYTRLGLRLAFDGYRVVAAGPRWSKERLTTALGAHEGPAPIVLIGSDTGATRAWSLAAAVGTGLAGIVVAALPTAATDSTGPGSTGPEEGSPGAAGRSWDEELDARTACPVHRRRLTEDVEVVRGALWSAPAGGQPPVTAQAGPQVPVLVLHGEQDVISPLDAVRTFLSAVDGVRLVVVAGGRHDVLNDLNHRSVAAEIVQFLERLRLSTGAEPILAEGTVGV